MADLVFGLEIGVKLGNGHWRFRGEDQHTAK